MKRGGPLPRRTPLRTTTPLARTTRARLSVSGGEDWSRARAKVEAEGQCRVCGVSGATPGVRLEAAHVIGRQFDRRRASGARVVEPLDVIPLCRRMAGADERLCSAGVKHGGCHPAYDLHALSIREVLAGPEWAQAVSHVGEGAALRRTLGSLWRAVAA